jgi:hypothetical protein
VWRLTRALQTWWRSFSDECEAGAPLNGLTRLTRAAHHKARLRRGKRTQGLHISRFGSADQQKVASNAQFADYRAADRLSTCSLPRRSCPTKVMPVGVGGRPKLEPLLESPSGCISALAAAGDKLNRPRSLQQRQPVKKRVARTPTRVAPPMLPKMGRGGEAMN